VIEICSISGWVVDLIRELKFALEVANTNGDGWRWKKVKQKNDRLDGLKLAQLSALGMIVKVHVPKREVRQWRAFINHRQQLVRQRTRIKNRIRELLNREGLALARGAAAWTFIGKLELQEHAKAPEPAGLGDLWRAELGLELASLERVESQIADAEKLLNEIGKAHSGVQLLQTIPGVGPRTAEALVAVIDEPGRFRSGKEVGAYLGLVPKQLQSGETNRLGNITRAGNRVLRSLLVEVSWAGLRHNPWMREIYQRAYRGSKTRKKIAIIAVARRLAICGWAMLRDGQRWQPERKLRLGDAAGRPAPAAEAKTELSARP
jgi:transposase